MITFGLPKGRNLDPSRASLAAAGLNLDGLDSSRLRQRFPDQDVLGTPVEVLLLKDWDLPLYVEHGIVDCAIVGSDVLEETQPDVFRPLQLKHGRSRLSLIAETPELPKRSGQLRAATRYPAWAARLLAKRNLHVEVIHLTSSIELGPLLDLTDVAVDIVQTGTTLRTHDLHEVEVLAAVAPTFVVNRASFHAHRRRLSGLLGALEKTETGGD